MPINAGDTAWVLVATALVMLMTPGVGFFYGGLVRRKNIISMIALSFVAFALISIQWVLYGYSLAFGPDIGGIVGGLSFIGLNGVGLEPAGTATIPPLVFMMFQLVFATVTLAHPDIGIRRKGQALLVHRLRAPVEHFGVRPHCPLGLGRRLAGAAWRPGLRGRHRSPHQRGFLGAGHLARDRQASRLWNRPHGAQ